MEEEERERRERRSTSMARAEAIAGKKVKQKKGERLKRGRRWGKIINI